MDIDDFYLWIADDYDDGDDLCAVCMLILKPVDLTPNVTP